MDFRSYALEQIANRYLSMGIQSWGQSDAERKALSAALAFKDAIVREEAEYGFPFSFDLRAAHRAFVTALAGLRITKKRDAHKAGEPI